MTAVIRAENLGKKYLIRHEQQGQRFRYDSLSESLANVGKAFCNRLLHPFSARPKMNGKEEFWALKDIDFEIQQGDRVGIIGRNGAGKSTLLKILSRITKPTTGKVHIKGRVASLLEVGTGFHPELTGRENIFLNGAILGMRKAEIKRKFDEIVDFAEVEKFLDTPVKHYSSGMYVRLAFAVAAHLEPEILIVDEVLAVGDFSFQNKCIGKMNDVARDGKTIVFVSHNMGAIKNLCLTTILLNNGNLYYNGETNNAISIFLKGIESCNVTETKLIYRSDRSGNGKIRLTNFWMEDTDGHKINTLQTGQNVVFIFEYESTTNDLLTNVDIGFSFDTDNKESVFGLYASYMGKTFTNIPVKGYFSCIVYDLAIAPGRYCVGARITVLGEEADWPIDGIAYVDVIPGDFYVTGSRGFTGISYLLVKGKWSCSV